MQEHVLLAKQDQEVGVYLQQKAPSAVRIAAQNFCRDLSAMKAENFVGRAISLSF